MEYYAGHRADVWGIAVSTSVIALSYNLVHVAMIKRTTAVTTTVLGEIKVVGIMLLSASLLGERQLINPRMLFGCALAMAGFCLYSQDKIAAMRRSASPPKLISLEIDASSAENGTAARGAAADAGQRAAPAMRIISMERRDTAV